MKILMVSSYLPYPLFSGGDIRLYNLIKNLKKGGYEITLICEKRKHQNRGHIGKLEEFCEKVLTVDRKKQWTIGNILKAGFSLSSFLSVGHNLPEMKNLIKEELDREKYDLIHVETYYVYQNLPKTDLPTILVEHNIEHLVYKRLLNKLNIFIRPFLMLDVWKIRNEEEKFWKKADRLVAVSSAEKKLMKRSDVAIVANGVDIEKFNIERKFDNEKKTRTILYIGNFKWIQNIDAVQWILKNVWPRITESAEDKGLNVRLWVVGKNIPENLKSFNDKSVVFDENASNETEKIYRAADLLLAPIRIGGGTNFKILESMATGLPVLTTHLGNEGIDAVSGKDTIICETPEDFADQAIDLLTNEKKYMDISKSARSFIRSNFEWENIIKKLEDVYKTCLPVGRA